MHAGGKVVSVRTGSIAEEIGIHPGDIIRSVNGESLNDVIDYRFFTAEENLRIEVIKPQGETWLVDVEKSFDDPLGIEFETDLFDGIRLCQNNCEFCFVAQLPRGMRRSLYVKDDDYRLSFLYGNFITLTNLADSDFGRIIQQRLSPLYVSIHTLNPGLRAKMLKNSRAAGIIEQLSRLLRAGIDVHCQIVLCPGVNDGEEFRNTVEGLSKWGSGIKSIAAVPVAVIKPDLQAQESHDNGGTYGVLKHEDPCRPQCSTIKPGRGHTYHVRPFTKEEASKVIQDVRKFQATFLESFGTRLVWASDELYNLAGEPIPPAEDYEDFPQIENGVGMMASFLEELDSIKSFPKQIWPQRSLFVVTGEMAAPLLEKACARLNQIEGVSARCIVVENRYFGPAVTVSGLLTGRDVGDVLSRFNDGQKDTNALFYIPSVVLRDGRFLDDADIQEVSRLSGKQIVPLTPTPSALFEKVLEGRQTA